MAGPSYETWRPRGYCCECCSVFLLLNAASSRGLRSDAKRRVLGAGEDVCLNPGSRGGAARRRGDRAAKGDTETPVNTEWALVGIHTLTRETSLGTEFRTRACRDLHRPDRVHRSRESRGPRRASSR